MFRMRNEPPAMTDGSLLEIKWLPECNPNANRSQWCFGTRIAALNLQSHIVLRQLLYGSLPGCTRTPCGTRTRHFPDSPLGRDDLCRGRTLTCWKNGPLHGTLGPQHLVVIDPPLFNRPAGVCQTREPVFIPPLTPLPQVTSSQTNSAIIS